ncbi:MAG TPA: hypothetical protein PLP21_05255 [Pyrinomonadaceae bacterium]|nr:hypothetical protein [Acidobacteriota bacterium]HQZ95702.1 hypothetical protein [Pyrinomonadaceae bacterium]
MKISRKIEMWVKTDRRYIIQESPATSPVNCPACGEQMLTAASSARILGITQRRVFQIVEMGGAHYSDNTADSEMICLSSLSAFLDAGRGYTGSSLPLVIEGSADSFSSPLEVDRKIN